MLLNAYITPISFPRNLEEIIGMLEKNESYKAGLITDFELLLRGYVDWTLPDQVRPGDFVFWEMVRHAPERLKAVQDELASAEPDLIKGSQGGVFSKEILGRKLEEIRPHFERYAGTIFAFGTVVASSEFDVDPFPKHFEGIFYSLVGGIKVLVEGIPLPVLEENDVEVQRCDGSKVLGTPEGILRLVGLLIGKQSGEGAALDRSG